MSGVDSRRLKLLLELSRHGSMRAVADLTGTATSAVSQQLAVLAREANAELIEPVGRNVRLTPAGKRLAAHAVIILGAIEAARVDLDPAAAPVGVVRVAAFATAIRDAMLPITRSLRERYPLVRLQLHEHEPDEIYPMLAADQLDLGIVYDYNLAPHNSFPGFGMTPLWQTPWGLGVPESRRAASSEPPRPVFSEPARPTGAGSAAVFSEFAASGWIMNSRGTADDDVVRLLAAQAGFTAEVAHSADSLELVQLLSAGGMGVGLLPQNTVTIPGVTVLPLIDPPVLQRAFAITNLGRELWPPLALVLRLLDELSRSR